MPGHLGLLPGYLGNLPGSLSWLPPRCCRHRPGLVPGLGDALKVELLRRRSLLLLLDGSAGSDPGVLVAPREAGGKVGEGLGKGGV